MYAVFKAGGHQLKGKEGDILLVDKLPGKEGEKVTFDSVLMLGGDKTVVGTPMVSGAKVEATIKTHKFNDKILIMHYRRRKNSKKSQGHRQPVTEIQINKISY